MMRVLLLSLSLALLGPLAGCGERDQSKTADNTNRADTPPFQGGNKAYTAGTWKAGEKGAWETQIRNRVTTQNEYAKIN
jgi:hypothetical protein